MPRETPYPYVKWAGGKGRMLGHIVPRVPQSFGRYFEPFLGAGALYFELARQGRIKNAYLGDTNTELMNAYRVLKAGASALVEELSDKSVYLYDRDAFMGARAADPAGMSDVKRAARFIYLNRTCFNGLYRVNKDGRFNTPFGTYKDPVICDSENLLAVGKALRRASLIESSFEWVEKRARAGDVVYFDPPYMPLSGTSKFTAYTEEGFGLVQHRLLSMTFASLARKGVCVILSNSATPEVRSLYRDYEIVELQGARNVGGPASYRKPVTELMVVANAAIPDRGAGVRPAPDVP